MNSLTTTVVVGVFTNNLLLFGRLRLIHPIRRDQIKFRDLHIEDGIVHQAHHLVFAFHAAHVGFEVAT